MAGFKMSDDDDVIADINVTPFVDIVLVLLIIFMATSSVIARTALEVQIPAASNAETKDTPPILSISLAPDGALELNGESVTREGLRSQIEAAVRENKQQDKKTQALITAAGTHPYQTVVDLIDLAKGLGVSSIALNTKPRAADFGADAETTP